jgi:hypothetical protein
LDFLPDRVTKQKRYNNTMLFRMESEIPPTIPLRLNQKIARKGITVGKFL